MDGMDCDARERAHDLHKAFVPFADRRRAVQSGNLHNVSFSFKAGGNEPSDDTSYLHVVRPDVSRIIAGSRLAVVDNYGNPALVSPVNGRRNSLDVARCHHKKVDLLPDQRVNLSHLTVVLVVGIGYPDLDIAILILSDTYLPVYLLPPSVIAALGHTDSVTRCLTAGHKQKQENQQAA